MRKTMALGLIMLATAACQDRRSGGPEAGAPAPASIAPAPAAETAGLAMSAASHNISVKLKMRNGQCVAEDPGRETVKPGDSIRWKYKNNCGAKKTQRIDRLRAPISGDCKLDTDVEDGVEKEGKDCTVDANARPGTYKYMINGTVILDPELDIPPPPPPMELKAEPTPTPK